MTSTLYDRAFHVLAHESWTIPSEITLDGVTYALEPGELEPGEYRLRLDPETGKATIERAT